MPLRHRSLLFGPLDVLVLGSLALALVLLLRPWREGGEIVRRDDDTLALVRRVAKAEHDFRDRRSKDANGDGIAEYGTIEDLAAAGLLDRPSSRDRFGGHLDAGGARVEVLLPERVGAQGRLLLSRSGGPVDPTLASATFAVVALVSGPRRGGLRSWYLDANDRLWYADEITDPEPGTGTRPPPWTLEEDTEEDAGPGPFWYRWKDAPAPP